jgi:hypothetical protein
VSVNTFLLIHLPSMADSDDGHDKPVVIDLVDGAVVADADAPGVAAPQLLAAGRAGIVLQLQ